MKKGKILIKRLKEIRFEMAIKEIFKTQKLDFNREEDMDHSF